jgi:hypothetical protein
MAKKYIKLSEILKKLLFERSMRPVDLARELDMPLPTVHRMVTGKSSRPYRSSLETVAKYFEVSIEQLTGEESMLPESLDDVKSFSISKRAKVVPIVSWESLGKNIKFETKESELVVVNVSENSFASVMPDSSMEPLFKKGATLIFDPDIPAIDRNYILVKLALPNIYVVRQLLIDVDQKFIKSLNPDIAINSIRLLNPNDEIIARLIEVRSQP